MFETIATDVLVVGGGSAAVRAAFEASKIGVDVILIDKGKLGQSGSSPYCLKGYAGPIAVGDNPARFYHDWTKISCGMADENLIWEAVEGAAANLVQLTEIGLNFRKEDSGNYYLYQGAGHSRARGLTIDYKEPNGNPIMVFAGVLRQRGVKIIEQLLITRLIKAGDTVGGAIGINAKGEVLVIKAKAVVLACGGANNLYPCRDARTADEKHSTFGASYCLAFHAGASIIDMEFCNFREVPPGASRSGGKYINAKGERFMERYDPVRLEKAPRQLTVAAFYTELKEGRWPIHWEIDEEKLRKDIILYPRFKNQKKIEVGIDFQRLLGGAAINENAETGIPYLFAAGESAGGVFGADRLQGGSFLETQLFGARAGFYAANIAKGTDDIKIDNGQVEQEATRIKGIKGNIEPAEVIKAIQAIMWERVSIVRDTQGLTATLVELDRLKREEVPNLSGEDIFAAVESLNLLLTAEMVTRAALTREETRGSHRRNDFAKQDDVRWRKHIAIQYANNKMELSSVPVKTIDFNKKFTNQG